VTTRVSPKHIAGGGQRPRIAWHDTALKQISTMTDEDRQRLDRLLTAVSLDPDIGTPDASGLLRDHQADGCRLLYVATALRSLIIIAYVEA